MGQKRWWPLARTNLLAHVLGAAVIGLCQFGLMSVRHPMACCGSPSPWDQLCYWVQSGRQRPLTEMLDRFDIHRLSESLAAIVFSGTLLAWSIWCMRRIRPALRLRLRTVMVIIAIVPVECAGGVAVWNRWERWDRDQRLADFNALWSAIEETPVRAGDVLMVDVFEALANHPITGEYTVDSNGKIDLGYYGRVHVADLTISEAKEKIVLYLRRYLDDRQLGLVELSASEPNASPSWTTSPSESDCVLVCVVDFQWPGSEAVGFRVSKASNGQQTGSSMSPAGE